MHRISRITKSCIKRNIITSAENNGDSSLTINDIPKPKTLPLLGTKLDFWAAGRGTKLHEYIDNRHKQLGPIFCEKLGGATQLVFVSDPALMKTLFLTLEGKYPAHILPDPWILYEEMYGSKRGLFFMNSDEWLTNRRKINKHLLRDNAEIWLESPVKQSVNNFITKWKVKAKNDCIINDLESELYSLSTDVIIKVLLGTNSALHTSKHYDELVRMFSSEVRKIFQTTTKLYGLPLKWCQRLDLKVWRNFKDCVDSSIFLAQKIVNEMLLNKDKSNGLIQKLSEEEVDDETICRIAADFVIAAGDTTAYTTLWTLIMLSENEVVINEGLKKDNAYVKCVVRESMRLYPVAPFLTRILPKECFLGPYKLNEGTAIIASIYTSGRDEQNFSEANKFLPYRWDRHDPRRKHLINHIPFASLPFALGARSCIGKKIAIMQLTEVISQIINTFNFKCLNCEDLKAITSQVLVPNKHIKLSISLKNE